VNKERCGKCQGCQHGFWCVEWGEPNEVQLTDMSDTEFGLVTRMLKGRHGSTTDDVVVADPPSRVHQESQRPPLIFQDGYEDEKLPAVKGQDPRSRKQEERMYRFDVYLPVTTNDQTEEMDVERKRAEVQRAMQMTLHLEHVEVEVVRIVPAGVGAHRISDYVPS